MKNEQNAPAKENESLNEKPAEVSNAELERVAGGNTADEPHFAAQYVCPFCHEVHNAGFTDLMGNEVIYPNLPCGKGTVVWIKNYSRSQTICLRNNKTGETVVTDFTLIVVASL